MLKRVFNEFKEDNRGKKMFDRPLFGTAPPPKENPTASSPASGKEGDGTGREQDLKAEVEALRRKLEESEKERKAQRQQVYELQDDLRTREALQDDLSNANESLSSELSKAKSEISNLLANLDKVPPNYHALLESWKKQKDFVEQLRECVVCPMCYEYLKKEQWASLRCGHCFCLDCLDKYSASHKDQWKKNPNVQGSYPGYDCPECRLPVFSASSKDSPFAAGHPGLKNGMWRVWILEEIVRHLEKREEKEEKEKEDWEKQLQGMLKGQSSVGEKKEEEKMDVDEPVEKDYTL
ncbi:hypothetical protein BT69DRAFT_1344796 [Atractiella rhizophila]|nr:hypothetical protein BT69DRAFT_1344796 [Atractiella rhizophila]